MKTGMLWFDDDPNSNIEDKVSLAADYYEEKHGHKPTTCFVHPNMLSDPALKVRGINICPNRTVLPDHFWIGLNN